MSADEQYLVEHVRAALAKDPRVNELELGVQLVGDVVYVTGTVASAQRREAVGEVVQEMLPDRQVRNQTKVVDVEGAPEEETLG